MADDRPSLDDAVQRLFPGTVVVKWALVVDLLQSDDGRVLTVASSPAAASWDALALLNGAIDLGLFEPDFTDDEEETGGG